MSDDFDDDKKRALSTIFLRCDIYYYIHLEKLL